MNVKCAWLHMLSCMQPKNLRSQYQTSKTVEKKSFKEFY